ncbi:hypothetical protein L6164_028177 [Bauhinia variegata]|uniref:Uncharacterized protein n=1 Tax=Bauhinia variegata TaxID=167791 RepID=A0ACB9LVL1_BAUVA|nr:hypothetical protein L6164_028177 [Bauhinia variegata]
MDDDDLSRKQKLPCGLITGIKFDVSTEDYINKISALKINAASQVSCSDLGLPNSSSECSTCGSKDLKSCEGHFGVIEFPFTIIHPYFLSEIAQILNKICPSCKSIRRIKGAHSVCKNKQPKGCKYCTGSSVGQWYPKMKFKVSSTDLLRRTAIIVEISDNLLKKRNRLVPADYWNFIPKDAQQEESCMRPNRRVLSHAQVHYMLKDVDPEFIKKFVSRADILFLNSFPVTPNCHRVSESMHASPNGSGLIYDERTRACKKLVDFRGTAFELSSRVLDCLRISKLNPDKTPSNSFADIQKKKNAEFVCNSSGLRWMKDVILGKRNDHCFRTVVVGDPDLQLNEIGIPRQIAESLQVSEYVNRHNMEKLLDFCELRILEKGQIYVRRKDSLVGLSKKGEVRIGDIFYRPLIDGDTILVNRPPSIHQHSLIALSVKVLPITSVVSINPICCSPFRGDFDGDCLHGYIPQSVDARVELNELVALDKQLTNGQSGRNLLSLSQDSLTAAYLLMEDGIVLNSYQMQQLEMFCPRKLTLPAIVKAPSLDTTFWTGKQLFSMLLPSDFQYSFPSNSVFVKDGELITSEGSAWLRDSDNNIFLSLVQHCQGKSLDFLYAAQKVLCEWLSMTGFSVSLSDLYLCSDSYLRKNMMDEVLCGLEEAKYACNFKQLLVDSNCSFLLGSTQEDENAMAFEMDHLNYERQISAALSQSSVDAFRQVFREIQSLVYKYACNGNSFLAMFKAGSKGNLLKLVQHAMCVGLQHSLVRLPFRIPHQLSCAAWNSQSGFGSTQTFDDTADFVHSYIPYAIVEKSFLSGLNPLECFVHSVTSRDSSFSDNADLPGTLTRRLMFFMRDLCSSYDGTVRNSYGNQLVQFSYDTDKDLSSSSFGKPVGALSACAISEAAYSALDQPISLLETSPLLNLKNVLECGSKKKSGDQTVSLFLSKKLGRERYGFEYGALQIKNHLERLMFSDIVSTVMILYTPQTCSFIPWVCHFHLRKEIVWRRKLKMHSIIDFLEQGYDSIRTKSKNYPCLKILSKDYSVTDKGYKGEDSFCITVMIVEITKDFVQLDFVRDSLIPVLLGTAIQGFQEIKKVNILWNNRSKVSKSDFGSSGELYLRVTMSGNSSNGRFWSALMDHCLEIMHLIDWARSHPDNIHHVCSAYGIDAGWKYFLHSLESAISDTGKTILPEHLLLVANSLSATGEFVGLNAKGLAKQRKQASVSPPFVQACFSNPGSCFIKAAKVGVMDHLQGSLDELAWGKCPSIGTGGQFDIIYSEKGHEVAKSVNVYNLLEASSDELNEEIATPEAQNYISDKCDTKYRKGSYHLKSLEKLEIWRWLLTVDDIQKLTHLSRRILNKHSIDEKLSERDKSTMMSALYFHPHKNKKIGTGVQDIKVGWHPVYQNTRCFQIVRTDGTVEDFSYHKCIERAYEIIDPERAKSYKNKYLVYALSGSCTFSNQGERRAEYGE